jgi:CLIP-associating protein 1/2
VSFRGVADGARLSRGFWGYGTSATRCNNTVNIAFHAGAPRLPLTTKMPDMLEQTTTLLAALKKPSTNVEQRLQLFNNVKSNIKHNRVPEECQAPIFECICIAIGSATSAVLVSTGLSTLSHFLKRLQLQRETGVVTSQSSKLCALLADKLGDARESHRSASLQILAELHSMCPVEVDGVISNAMKGANARAKDTSMTWVVKVRNSAEPRNVIAV